MHNCLKTLVIQTSQGTVSLGNITENDVSMRVGSPALGHILIGPHALFFVD